MTSTITINTTMTSTTAHEEHTTMSSANPSRSAVRVVRDALSTVLARVYLVACLALLVWALVMGNIDSPDASLAGVWPVFATAPVSLVLLVLPDHASMLFVAVGLGALVNAVFIGWCVRALSGRRDGTTSAGQPGTRR
ncbi:SCO4225 family membrane protein [Streptomyces sp. NPDC054796]